MIYLIYLIASIYDHMIMHIHVMHLAHKTLIFNLTLKVCETCYTTDARPNHV